MITAIWHLTEKTPCDKNVGEMKDSINRMTNRINIQQITDAMTKISKIWIR